MGYATSTQGLWALQNLWDTSNRTLISHPTCCTISLGHTSLSCSTLLDLFLKSLEVVYRQLSLCKHHEMEDGSSVTSYDPAMPSNLWWVSCYFLCTWPPTSSCWRIEGKRTQRIRRQTYECLNGHVIKAVISSGRQTLGPSSTGKIIKSHWRAGVGGGAVIALRVGQFLSPHVRSGWPKVSPWSWEISLKMLRLEATTKNQKEC